MSNKIKSKLACEWSVEGYAKNEIDNGRRVAFWTITTKEAESVATVSYWWKVLNERMKYEYGSMWGGIRVYEMHPGDSDGNHSHGLHIHFITSMFIPIRKMLGICESIGFGRVGVEVVQNIEGVKAYLSKYLAKSQKDSEQRVPCLKGMRLWACFGAFLRSSVRSKVCNIEHDTPLRRWYHVVRGVNFTFMKGFKASYYAAGSAGRKFRYAFLMNVRKSFYIEEIGDNLRESWYLNGWTEELYEAVK